MGPFKPQKKQKCSLLETYSFLLGKPALQTSPGRKQEKRSPIVKLNKEQPQAPSISGTSVPVPSGQSWVTEDNQKFKWTWKRIALAVFTVAAIIVALLVAFLTPQQQDPPSRTSVHTQKVCHSLPDTQPGLYDLHTVLIKSDMLL